MRNGLDRLIYRRHFERAINRIAESNGGARAASQMSGNQHIRSGAGTFWHYGVGCQFELNNSTVHAEQSNDRCCATAASSRDQP
jgi:hypothetical protein